MAKAKKTEQKKESSTSALIQPLGDRVLVEPAEEDQLSEKNTAGIIIPETADQEKPQQGKVIAVGPGRLDESGKRVPMGVKKGDTVIFSKFGYDTVTVNDTEYYILKEDTILAVIK
ncbi:MAG: co-chaperone GroES [Candidatus Paceibacterota bacterium]